MNRQLTDLESGHLATSVQSYFLVGCSVILKNLFEKDILPVILLRNSRLYDKSCLLMLPSWVMLLDLCDQHFFFARQRYEYTTWSVRKCRTRDLCFLSSVKHQQNACPCQYDALRACLARVSKILVRDLQCPEALGPSSEVKLRLNRRSL